MDKYQKQIVEKLEVAFAKYNMLALDTTSTEDLDMAIEGVHRNLRLIESEGWNKDVPEHAQVRFPDGALRPYWGKWWDLRAELCNIHAARKQQEVVDQMLKAIW
jgi:hypothetical protein